MLRAFEVDNNGATLLTYLVEMGLITLKTPTLLLKEVKPIRLVLLHWVIHLLSNQYKVQEQIMGLMKV